MAKVQTGYLIIQLLLKNSTETRHLTNAMKEFVNNFDMGEYPSLVEGKR